MLFWKNKVKKIRKRPFFGSTLQQLQRKKYLLVTTGISFLCACFFVGRRMYMKTLWSPAHSIQKVVFAPESVNALRAIDLYTDISDNLHDKNYYRTKRLFKKKLLQTIQTAHPLVQDISLEQTAPSTVLVSIVFLKPTLLRQTPSSYFISYQEHIYPVSSGSILMAWLFPVQLPLFSSGWVDINGIYESLGEEELAKYINQLTTSLSRNTISELIYQPWGKRLFVTYKGKRVYFNLQKDLTAQLEKLHALEDHREWFANIWIIDVGSRDEAIVK